MVRLSTWISIGNRGQGAGCREQGTGNREQGTGNREPNCNVQRRIRRAQLERGSWREAHERVPEDEFGGYTPSQTAGRRQARNAGDRRNQAAVWCSAAEFSLMRTTPSACGPF
jgi:SRSO17 transposase